MGTKAFAHDRGGVVEREAAMKPGAGVPCTQWAGHNVCLP